MSCISLEDDSIYLFEVYVNFVVIPPDLPALGMP